MQGRRSLQGRKAEPARRQSVQCRQVACAGGSHQWLGPWAPRQKAASACRSPVTTVCVSGAPAVLQSATAICSRAALPRNLPCSTLAASWPDVAPCSKKADACLSPACTGSEQRTCHLHPLWKGIAATLRPSPSKLDQMHAGTEGVPAVAGEGAAAAGAASAPLPSRRQRLLRASVDGVRAAVDFETLFLALGLAHWGTQQVGALASVPYTCAPVYCVYMPCAASCTCSACVHVASVWCVHVVCVLRACCALCAVAEITRMLTCPHFGPCVQKICE